MKKTTPLVKGLITGAVMLITTMLLFYYARDNAGFRYLVFAMYAGGIAWTLLEYYRSPEYTGRFGDIFGKGFRCFIVVTVIMVTFAGIFSAAHPEFAEQDAELYREELIKHEKSKTPAEIDSIVALFKKNYTVSNIRSATFGYLVTGAIFTAAGAGLLLMRRKQ
jgi:hypothetical protein